MNFSRLPWTVKISSNPTGQSDTTDLHLRSPNSHRFVCAEIRLCPFVARTFRPRVSSRGQKKKGNTELELSLWIISSSSIWCNKLQFLHRTPTFPSASGQSPPPVYLHQATLQCGKLQLWSKMLIISIAWPAKITIWLKAPYAFQFLNAGPLQSWTAKLFSTTVNRLLEPNTNTICHWKQEKLKARLLSLDSDKYTCGCARASART